MKHNLTYTTHTKNYKSGNMHFETVIGLEVHVELKQTQKCSLHHRHLGAELTQALMLLI